MTRAIIPTVVVEDVPVPHWARVAIGGARRRLDRPDSVLAVRVDFLPPAFPDKWEYVSVDADGADDSLFFISAPGVGYPWKAMGLSAGRHTVTFDCGGQTDLIEPITLDFQPGTVVLVEVQPDNLPSLRWLSPGPPSVTCRLLPRGLAHNGRWGRRWARRLGWTGPDGRPPEGAPRPVGRTRPQIVPAVTVEEAPVPRWAYSAVKRTRRDPPGDPPAWPAHRPECVLALRLGNQRPWARLDFGTLIGLLADATPVTYADTGMATRALATGIAAGRHTFSLDGLPRHRNRVRPVVCDVPAGSVVLVEARSSNRWAFRWLGDRSPSVRLRILQPASCQAFFQRLDEPA